MATIAILGSGTMGSGIAQVCAQHNFDVLLYDLNETLLEKGRASIQKSLNKAAEKNKAGMHSLQEIENILKRIETTANLADLAPANLVIEAVTEKIEVKRDLFQQLDQIMKPTVLFASNTSSLSITAIASATQRPDKVLGLHFFNPANLMKLVEVVKGDLTSTATLDAGLAFVRALGKTAVVCKDTPAFIVNRVARPFYGEALRLMGENAAAPFTIDLLMKSLGFRMGPFELMDMIGLDVNYAVTKTVYNAYFQDPKYRPHPIQQKMVESGRLGRKTKRGFYEYP
jgi:3-hydroxybutyryl-CoA dehydrogenase